MTRGTGLCTGAAMTGARPIVDYMFIDFALDGLPDLHYQWEWRLRSTPEQLWPLVSDTNRFNRDTGLPAVRRVGGETGGNAAQRLGFSRFGVRLEWDEEPFVVASAMIVVERA